MDDYHRVTEEFRAFRRRSDQERQEQTNSAELAEARLRASVSRLEAEKKELSDSLHRAQRYSDTAREDAERLRKELNDAHAQLRDAVKQQQTHAQGMLSLSLANFYHVRSHTLS